MNTKVDESKLISGKEALIALANGQDVEYMNTSNTFKSLGWGNAFGLETNLFFSDRFKFRLKPRTITLNNIEIPAPFEPKDGEDCRCYYISTTFKHGFDWYHSTHHESNKIAWRTEEEIKQVVSALRSVFKGGV